MADDPTLEKLKGYYHKGISGIESASNVAGGLESAGGRAIQKASDAAGALESWFGHTFASGLFPSDPAQADPAAKDKQGLTKAQEKYLKPGDIKGPTPPTTEQLLNQYMQPYINEISNLGPEYNDEMAFLKPYLAPTTETMSQLVATSKANESPTGDTGVMNADVEAGKAAADQYGNKPIPGSDFTVSTAPGFNAEAGAAKTYTKDLPYSQLLTTLLQAGKNQILGYSTIPNLSAINTSAMPPEARGAYSAAVQGLGYNPATNLPNTATAATQAAQQAQLQAQNTLQGGGSTG